MIMAISYRGLEMRETVSLEQNKVQYKTAVPENRMMQGKEKSLFLVFRHGSFFSPNNRMIGKEKAAWNIGGKKKRLYFVG